MKQKHIVTIFALIITGNDSFCMEKEKQIEKITQVGETVFTRQGSNPHKHLKIALENSLTTTNGIEHSTTLPQWQYTTLKRHIKKGNLEALHLCLEYKLNPNRYLDKLSLLHYSIKHHKDTAVTMLSHYDPDLMPLNKEHQTPLDYAISLQCQPCIDAIADAIVTKIKQLLIYQKQCKINHYSIEPEFYEECLDLIWQLRGYRLQGIFPYASLETLLSQSIVKENNKEYSSIPSDLQYETLKHCIEKDDMIFLTLYLTYKFNPNRYRKQLSLLHYAVEHCKPKAITILAQYNPDLTPQNPQEETPLDYATNLQCKECIHAMAKAMNIKYKQFTMYKQHCGLIKHILNPGPCYICQEDLKKQLERYNLSDPCMNQADLEEVIIDSRI